MIPSFLQLLWLKQCWNFSIVLFLEKFFIFKINPPFTFAVERMLSHFKEVKQSQNLIRQPILGIHIYSDILSYKQTKASLSLERLLKLFQKFLSKTHYAYPKNNTLGQQEKKYTKCSFSCSILSNPKKSINKWP